MPYNIQTTSDSAQRTFDQTGSGYMGGDNIGLGVATYMGHSPRLTLTSWGSMEQQEIQTELDQQEGPDLEEEIGRTGVDPERAKSLSDVEIPNFKEQEEAERLRTKNMEVGEWRSQAGESTDADDGTLNQSNSTLNAPPTNTRRGARSTSEIPSYLPPVVLFDTPRIKKDPTEGEDIDPVSDTESVRENQVKDGQLYFNPKATGINARDQTWMQECRQWSDGPVYPYVMETKIQAQTANEAAKRWNEAADTFSVLSRTATWGTRRRSELSIADMDSINHGSFLKRLLFKTDKEFKIEREKRSNLLIDSITNMVRKKRDSSKPKRNRSGKECRGRPEAGPVIKQEGRGNLAPPSGPISARRRGSSSPRLNTNVGGSSISGWSHGGSGSVSATASSPKQTSGFHFGAAIRRARRGSNLQHDPSKDGIYAMWKQTGGPPVAKLGATPFDSDMRPLDFSDTKAGDYSDADGEDDDEEEPADDGEMMDFDQNTPITPNFAGFQEHVIGLYPLIERTYLVDRIAHQQVVRYKALLQWRVKHQGSIASQNCPAGLHCIALGGSPTPLEPKNQHRDSDASNAGAQGLVDVSNGDSNPEGALAAESFPPGVPTPPAQTLPAEFECQLCFRVKKFQKPLDWTKHVHEDVQPFTCTYANCKEPKSFRRKADWVRHENERHRRLSWWTCTRDDCQHKCYRKDNFLQHLVREHKIPEPKQKTKATAKKARNSDEAIWVLIRNCHHETTAKPQDEPCKFCGKVLNSWKKLTVHLAKHMELISLSVLRLVEQQSVNADTIISPVEPMPVRQAPDTPVDNTDRRLSNGSIPYSSLSPSISPHVHAMPQFSSPFYPQASPSIPEMPQFLGVMHNQNMGYNTTTTGQDVSQRVVSPSDNGIEGLNSSQRYNNLSLEYNKGSSVANPSGKDSQAQDKTNLESSYQASTSTEQTDVSLMDYEIDHSDDDLGPPSVDGTEYADAHSEERLTDPRNYFRKLETLEREIYETSSICVCKRDLTVKTNIAPAHGGRHVPPLSWTDKSLQKSIESLMEKLQSHLLQCLLDCHNTIQRSSHNIQKMQAASFCGGYFSVLVQTSDRPEVANLFRIDVDKIMKLYNNLEATLKALGSLGPRTVDKFVSNKNGLDAFLIDSVKNINIACEDILNGIGLQRSANSTPIHLWCRTTQIVDFAIMCYAGAHIERFDIKFLNTDISCFRFSNSGLYYDNYQAGSSVMELYAAFSYSDAIEEQSDLNWPPFILQRRRLQCLDKLLGGMEVWVFHQSQYDTQDDTRLYLSTDIETLTDIWGPLWKNLRKSNPGQIERLDIGNGSIVPWASHPNLNSPDIHLGEVYCHWIPIKNWNSKEIEDHQKGLERKYFQDTDRLLIGAKKHGLLVNRECILTVACLRDIKSALHDECALQRPGTDRPRRYTDSYALQVQGSVVSALSGAAMVTYKRRKGQNMKDTLVERWRNIRNRNPGELEAFYGIEVSLCTQNARRRRLLELLNSTTMRKYLKGMCEKAFKLERTNFFNYRRSF